MTPNAQALQEKCRHWLSENVFPLWTEKGIDPRNGSFIESLSADKVPTAVPRRAMVQARQIYVYTEAVKMGLLKPVEATPIVAAATEFLISNYSLPSGAFLHAVTAEGKAESLQSELYSQAFVLFGLARAYELLGRAEIKKRALDLLKYLQTERRNPAGGYTEVKNDETVYQSNPHMHLFEAAIAWVAADRNPQWRALAEELNDLGRDKFFNPEVGALAEHFTADWQPLREDGKFFFEPGHQYEWAWLFCQYAKVSNSAAGDLPAKLFAFAEEHGVQKSTGLALDEIWSDFKIKKATARFWPQCERIKTALELGNTTAADEAMNALWLYLDSPAKGLWQDTKDESGAFIPQATKASSLYHILNAMSDYLRLR
jgi:mannose/cellobiose epimerase-like protein (N-acyl-D-glucosamine 2-epimerase family)